MINNKIAIIITRRDGAKEINNGLISKLRAIAPPIREINSKDNPIATPKNIFLPKQSTKCAVEFIVLNKKNDQGR